MANVQFGFCIDIEAIKESITPVIIQPESEEIYDIVCDDKDRSVKFICGKWPNQSLIAGKPDELLGRPRFGAPLSIFSFNRFKVWLLLTSYFLLKKMLKK